MSGADKSRGRFRKVWGAPLVLGVLGLVGLVAALIGDGALDAVSYLLLTVQLVVIAWYIARRTR
ncbi:MAG: hypothetical protein AB7O49_10005 [Sphingomonadales bacterium]